MVRFPGRFRGWGECGGRGAARAAGMALVLVLAATVMAAAADPAPLTTADPAIDLGDLKLLVDPLTRAEVEVEARGWFGLVRAKVAEVSEAELAVRRKNREIKALGKVKAAAEKVAATSSQIESEAEGSDAEKARRLAEAEAALARSVAASRNGQPEPASAAAPAATSGAAPAAKAEARPGQPKPDEAGKARGEAEKGGKDKGEHPKGEKGRHASSAPPSSMPPSSAPLSPVPASPALSPAHMAPPGHAPAVSAATDTDIVNRAVTEAVREAEKTGDGSQVAGMVEAASKEAEAAREVEVLAVDAETASSAPPAVAAAQEERKAEALTAELDRAEAAKSDVKVELVDYSTRLASERTALTDRLNLVLDNLELKGGKAEEMRQYVAAVGGLNIDVTDQTATVARVRSWLTAEEGGLRWARNLGIFLGYVLGSVVLAWIVRGIVNRMMGVAGAASNLLRNFVINWSGRVVVFAGILAGLSALEVNLAPLLAIIGAAGFVVAFALQGTLSNFASGLLIMVNKPFDVGDDVTVGGDIAGEVQEVNTFSTVIHADDGTVKIVPNNSIWGGVIVNRSTGRITREGEPASTADIAVAKRA